MTNKTHLAAYQLLEKILSIIHQHKRALRKLILFTVQISAGACWQSTCQNNRLSLYPFLEVDDTRVDSKRGLESIPTGHMQKVRSCAGVFLVLSAADSPGGVPDLAAVVVGDNPANPGGVGVALVFVMVGGSLVGNRKVVVMVGDGSLVGTHKTVSDYSLDFVNRQRFVVVGHMASSASLKKVDECPIHACKAYRWKNG
jgi:hypothetical protein